MRENAEADANHIGFLAFSADRTLGYRIHRRKTNGFSTDGV